MRRALLLATILFIVAGGIAAVAVADHRHKNERMGPAYIASWDCEQRHERCDEPQWQDLEAAWQRRELFYRGGFYAVSVAGLGAAAVALTVGVRHRRSGNQSLDRR